MLELLERGFRTILMINFNDLGMANTSLNQTIQTIRKVTLLNLTLTLILGSIMNWITDVHGDGALFSTLV